MTKSPRRPDLSAAWVEDLPAVAQMHAALWARGVAAQHDRIAAGSDDTELQLLDSMLYLVCLRNLMRAAELVRDAAAERDFGASDEALVRFEARCPAVTRARNWIEHFDEYALGLGRDRSGARGRTPLRVSVADSESGHVLRLVSHGRTLTIALEETTSAAVDLWLDLVQAADIVDEFGGDPGDE